MSVGLTAAILNTYDGKSIGEICTYWYTLKTFNHCAHFVSHVLGIGDLIGKETCARLTVPKDVRTKNSITGANVRVNEVFAMCSMCAEFDVAAATTPLAAATPGGAAATIPVLTTTSAGGPAMSAPIPTLTSTTSGAASVAGAVGGGSTASSAPPDECLVYVTLASNVDLKLRTMADSPYKHIGIYFKGQIWQHGKTFNKVAVLTPKDFSELYASTGKKPSWCTRTSQPERARWGSKHRRQRIHFPPNTPAMPSMPLEKGSG